MTMFQLTPEQFIDLDAIVIATWQHDNADVPMWEDPTRALHLYFTSGAEMLVGLNDGGGRLAGILSERAMIEEIHHTKQWQQWRSRTSRSDIKPSDAADRLLREACRSADRDDHDQQAS